MGIIKHLSLCGSLFLLLILFSVPAYADKGKDSKNDDQALISQVSFINDYEIQIYGSNLGGEDKLRVMLGAYQLVVSLSTPSLIQASLPPGLLAGEYLLTVSKDDHHNKSTPAVASYDLTVGAARAIDLENHTGNRGNPHGVSSAQIGAAAAGDLLAHVGNTNNPHGVTTDQIGASTPADVAFVVAAHAINPSIHHSKTTSFVELTDTVQDAQIPLNIARLGSNVFNFVPRWNGSEFEGGSIFDNGHVGIGTASPGSAKLYIKANVPGPIVDVFGTTHTQPEHHVAIIENTRATLDDNDITRHNSAGLAIILNNHNTDFLSSAFSPLNRLNSDDHFVTFYSKNNAGESEMVGRIEGVSLYDISEITNSIASSVVELAAINPFSMIKFDMTNMIVPTTNNDWLTWTPPSASLNGGSFPTPYANTHCEGDESTLPNQVCIGFLGIELDMGLDGGTWPTLNFNPGSLLVNKSPVDFAFNAPDIGIDLDIAADFASKVGAASKAANQSQQRVWSAIFNPVGFKLEAQALTGVAGGVTYASGAGDYAEWLERSDPKEEINVAEIVGVKGGKVSKKTDAADHVLVTSFKPIVLGNMPASDKQKLYEKVAFMGQTLVKVRGGVQKGDYILPSGLNDGVGIAISPHIKITPDRLAQIVGVVWSDDAVVTRGDIRMVNIAVGLRSSEVARAMKVQQLEINDVHARMDEASKKMASLVAENRKLLAEVDEMRSEFSSRKAKFDELSARLEMLVRVMDAGQVVQAEYSAISGN